MTDEIYPPNSQDDISVTPQKRSVITIVIGCLLIAFCLCFIALVLSCYCSQITFYVGVLTTIPAIFLACIAFLQYRALFACDPVDSRSFTGCFFYMAAPCFLVALITAFEYFQSSGHAWQILMIAVILGLVFVITTGMGILSAWNNQRRKRLVYIPPLFSKNPPRPMNYWKREVLGLAIMSALVAGMTLCIISINPPDHGNNLSHAQLRNYSSMFPKEGCDFCFIRSMHDTLHCEFTIDEQGFQDWINGDDRWEYCRPIQEDDWIDILPKTAYQTGDHRSFDDGELSPQLSDGLYAGYGEYKGGRAVFDRANNRVYYWTFIDTRR